LLRRLVWWLDINVSENRTASIFTVKVSVYTGTGTDTGYIAADSVNPWSQGIEPSVAHDQI